MQVVVAKKFLNPQDRVLIVDGDLPAAAGYVKAHFAPGNRVLCFEEELPLYQGCAPLAYGREDNVESLSAGLFASACVKGVQSQKICATVKHYCANNQETNRYTNNSQVSERAMREIYLRGFEICVKEADPWTIMSSYNRINGQHTSESYELLTEITRNEWGFKGMVTTDWWTRGEHYKELLAGNDLKMATGYPERLLAAVEAGVLTREEMEVCVKRILGVILWLD